MMGENTPKTLIEILNDDCLEQVFSYLPTMAEKMRLERVSKRWQKISQNTWKSVKVLDLKRTTNMKWGLSGKKLAKRLSVGSISKILRLCGGSLREISTDNRKLSNAIIENAGQLCPNIKYVEIAGCTWTLLDTDNTLAACDKLVIKLLQDDECFSRLFSRLTSLRCLEISDAIRHQGLIGNGLSKLPKSIEELILIRVNVTEQSLNMAIRELPNLRSIELDLNNCVSVNFFKTISTVKTLRQLKLYGSTVCTWFRSDRLYEQDEYTEAVQLIANISNLEVLVFKQQQLHPYIPDQFIKKIVEACPNLRYLDISASGEITDEGINALTSCANLETLIINKALHVTDSSLCER